MKKVLVIEYDKEKAQNIIRQLNTLGITDITWLKSQGSARCYLRIDYNIEDCSLIVLDLSIPILELRSTKNVTSTSGRNLLFNIAESYKLKDGKTIPDIIVYHPNDNYMDVLHQYYLPSYKKYCQRFENDDTDDPMTEQQLQVIYNDYIARTSRVISAIYFVIGQAHNDDELFNMLKTWAENHQ